MEERKLCGNSCNFHSSSSFFSEHLELVRDDFFRLTLIDKDQEDCSFLSVKFSSIRLTTSRVYTLKFDSHKFSVYCHMGDFGCGDGRMDDGHED